MNAPKVNIHNYITPDEYENLIQSEEVTKELELDHITKAYEELKSSKFEILETEPFLDEAKLFIRGAVTRIGAYSNIGKSKLAYWLTVKLLKRGYAGVIFSTEVNRHTVLSNLVSCIDHVDFWDVVDKRHDPSPKSQEVLFNLQIYDSKHGALFLKTIREYIIANGGRLDFIVTDFCQNIKDYQFSRSEYEQMSNYALEIQQLSQHYNVCIIDLSQLANASVKEDFKKSGFISFKGSGALYASADIGIQLNRDKVNNPDIVWVEVRKHKFNKTGDFALKVDWANNDFRLMNPNIENLNVDKRVILSF